MKYYLIVGEASGDLHASHLMKALKEKDSEAEFRFYGGDKMSSVGGTRVRHYKELAYMGFFPVLLHLPTILKNMSFCKQDIMRWKPDIVIPVDYAGFNLNICKFLHKQRAKRTQVIDSQSTSPNAISTPHIYYYIAPKIWAWKEYRIKNFKRDVDEMFCILPFEVDFFQKKHNYPVHYIGNPTADEIREFKGGYSQDFASFCNENKLEKDKPIVALLSGSRIQEIKANLPTMIDVALRMNKEYKDEYQFVIAGAPSIDSSVYATILESSNSAGIVHIVKDKTYPLLYHSTAALVTSGTATLETALFNVPQVVCYKTSFPKIIRWGFNHVIKCKYISLVNLIADEEVVPELFADRFSEYNIYSELKAILPNGSKRQTMLKKYQEVHNRLGNNSAPHNAAKLMISLAAE